MLHVTQGVSGGEKSIWISLPKNGHINKQFELLGALKVGHS